MVRGIFVRCIAGLACALIVSSSFGAQEVPPKTIQLPDGTPIHLYLKDDLNSKSSRNGDRIRFQVREDVLVGNVVVVPAGSPAQGHVIAVGHRGMAGHSGRLSFSVDYVAAPDGTKIPVVSKANVSGGSNGKVAAAAAATYGPEALLMRGWNADIRKGTTLNAYVFGDREIGMANLTVRPSYTSSSDNPTPAAPTPPALTPRPQAAPQPAPAAAAAELATIVVKSIPDGADITLDGKFVGSTPSTVRLPPGDHTIALEKSGYKTWQRTMTVGARASITIGPMLEKNP